jgi:hypothetical protein
MGPTEVISSLRLWGISAILFRLKRQVREGLAALEEGVPAPAG